MSNHKNWSNQDNSVPFEDLLLLETSQSMGGLMGGDLSNH